MPFDWASQCILVADHDEQFRFFVRGLFKHHRVRDVLSVGHANEIPRILAHHRIDVAFVELTHEEPGIARTLQWLRNDKNSPAPKLPVILLVKDLDRVQLARVCAFGIHGVLQKPVSGEQLIKAVIGVATNPRMFKSAGERTATTKPKAVSFAARSLVASPSDDRSVPRGAGISAGGSADAGEEAVAAESSRRTGGFLDDGAPFSPRATGFLDVGLPVGKKIAGGTIEVPEPEIPPTLTDLPDEPHAGKRKSRRQKRGDDGDEAVAPEEPALVEAAASPKKKQAQETSGPSVEDILAAHALWVQGGGQGGQRANLTGRDLCGLMLVEAVLTSVILRRADLSGSDFSGAELHGADLRDTELLGCKFVGADLAVARLRHAKLRGCLFAQACLKGADLAGADLSGAKMGDADLTGAILLGARLDDADLSGVSGLTQGQLDDVEGNARTRLPPGLFLPPPAEA
ncbi:MAG TPA: pentapeptide repeat-containing protein [Telmatospirillum sp.]|nr:pentapeptide repeat-containing protein [Telmatospirillum sp.]